MCAWEVLAEVCATWTPCSAGLRQESQRGKFNMFVCPGLSDPCIQEQPPTLTSFAWATFSPSISPTPHDRRSNAANDA